MSYNIDQIKEDFKKVITYSQQIQNPKIDNLFDTWYANKEFFIKKFGDELIWESPEILSFPLDEQTRLKKFNNFVDNCVINRGEFELARFLREERDGFFDNITTKEYKVSPEITIPEGAKLSKAFKHFITDECDLDYFQTKASMLIQENKVEGRLCFSVHPLDFLSASENQHSWHSCHALDGEFRAGNLSYMGDKDTIMCYLKSEQNVKLPDFPADVPWNNKKWRMWLFLADEHNAIMAGRQYPFDIQGIREKIRTELFNLLNYNEHNWSHWHNDFAIGSYTYADGEQMFYRRSYPIGGGIIPTHQLIKDKSKLHYNDLLYSSCYNPYYCWRTITEADVCFSIGSEVKCFQCGEYNMDCSDTMICSNCYQNNQYGVCEACDERYPTYSLNYIDGHVYCTQCFERLYCTCAACGAYTRRDERFRDRRPGSSTFDMYLCRHCYNTISVEPDTDVSTSHTNNIYTPFTINLADIENIREYQDLIRGTTASGNLVPMG